MGDEEGMKTMTLKFKGKSNRSKLRITNELFKLRGVNNIVVDVEEQKVIIKGFYDTEALMKKVYKLRKIVEPWPDQAPEAPEAPEESQGPPPEEQLPLIMELKVPLHCQGCKRRVLTAITELRGVQRVEADMERQTVVVTGHIDVESVLRKIHAKTKKRAKVIAVLVPEPPKKEKKEAKKPNGEAKQA